MLNTNSYFNVIFIIKAGSVLWVQGVLSSGIKWPELKVDQSSYLLVLRLRICEPPVLPVNLHGVVLNKRQILLE